MRDRYLELIEQIITATLKGEIRSKEQVYQRLVQGVSAGTGEIFERCLAEQVSAVETQLKTEKDELKQAKATRRSRALKTIQGEWQRWQTENQGNAVLAQVKEQLLGSEAGDRLFILLQALDPNRPQVLTHDQIQQLAQQLQTAAIATDAPTGDLQQMATGLLQGLRSWQQLEGQLISWMYDQSRSSLGFGALPEDRGPWSSWAKQVKSTLPQQIFQSLARYQAIAEDAIPAGVELSDWVELTILLQRLQQGLVVWFDRQPYDPQAGRKLSIATFLTFSAIWSQLSTAFRSAGKLSLAEGCFQVMLQVLRTFAQQSYFPLYGGIFASLSGEYLRTTLDYLDQPLRQADNTQEKARILTLLGYSQRALGQYARALEFHQQALEIARAAGDTVCEIANFNHLSRTYVAQKDYVAAISASQRALILARQTGDRPGEANALASLGYSEVFLAQQQEQLEPEVYERAIAYLQQGLQLSERTGDRSSEALCYNSLGIAQVVLGRYPAAVDSLEKGLQIAQAIGDLFLQGTNLAYLAETYRSLGRTDAAIYAGSLGMYLLHQIDSQDWRQPAGMLVILEGQLGKEQFRLLLSQSRSQIIKLIGVDGYDYLPKLLEDYWRSLG
jgi:tetratricopeptide (TPR) repeat protein